MEKDRSASSCSEEDSSLDEDLLDSPVPAEGLRYFLEDKDLCEMQQWVSNLVEEENKDPAREDGRKFVENGSFWEKDASTSCALVQDSEEESQEEFDVDCSAENGEYQAVSKKEMRKIFRLPMFSPEPGRKYLREGKVYVYDKKKRHDTAGAHGATGGREGICGRMPS